MNSSLYIRDETMRRSKRKCSKKG